MAFVPMPEGVYEVRIDNQRFGESKTKKTPFFQVDFTIINRIDIATQQPVAVAPVQRTSDEIYITTETVTKGMVADRLVALGYRGANIMELNPDQPGFVSLAGNICRMTCTHEHNEGKVYEHFDVLTQGQRKPRVNNSSAAQKVQAIFGDRLRQTMAECAAKAPAPVTAGPVNEQQAQQPGGQASVPFGGAAPSSAAPVQQMATAPSQEAAPAQYPNQQYQQPAAAAAGQAPRSTPF